MQFNHAKSLFSKQKCQNRFHNLSGIPAFFSTSSKRMAVLEEVAHRQISGSLQTQ